MPPRPQGYDALTPESFGRLGARSAELFVRELVVHELTERHALGWMIEGPPAENAAGYDLRVRLAFPPRIDRQAYAKDHHAEPLTFDDAAGVPTVFSVKSGATGKEHAITEAINASMWAVEALEAGGRVVIVLTRTKDDPPTPVRKKSAKPTKKTAAVAGRMKPAAPKEPFTQRLKRSYADRIRARNPNAADPSDRVHVFDCNDLMTYLRGVRPATSAIYLDELGIPRLPGLLDLDRWEAHHQDDRPPAPDFVWDGARRERAKQIVDGLHAPPPASRKLWIVSPPGVGKTRLIVEALRGDAALRARTYAITNPRFALAALREHDFIGRFRDAIIVVDDCSEHDAAEIATAFAQMDLLGAASLVLVTPMSTGALTAQAPRGLAPILVPPMDDGASRTLIAAEGGFADDDPRVGDVATQTEGYPWFSILVSRELRNDPHRPAPRDVAEAVDLALCPPGPTFPLDVRRRAAGLMIVMLTDGEDLRRLTAEDRAELAALFDCFASWTDADAAISSCAERGVLRPGEGGIFRYVTPAILEVEIARRFLIPTPGPGGPGPLGPRLQSDRMRQRHARLLHRLDTLGFAEAELARLAAPIAARLANPPSGLVALRRVSHAELAFAARHLPGATAAAVRNHVEPTSLDELGAAHDLRRPLMFALQELATRRDTFEDAEASLFRLAQAENESYANNATATWAALFDLELNQTYRTFDEKRVVLESRLWSSDADACRVALGALGRMLDTMAHKLVVEPRDGPFLAPTPAEAKRARVWAWEALSRAMREGDELVVARAAEIAARELRGAARTYVLADAATSLSVSLARVREPELRRLRDAAAHAEQYDRPLIESQCALDPWVALRDALEPRSFRERLRQRVGAFGPVRLRDDKELDRALAREALEHPNELLAELEWLVSRDAVRAVPFAITLGAADSHRVVLDEVLGLAPSAPDFVSAYLSGHAEEGRADVTDEAIARMRSDPTLGDAVAVAIWRARATPRRLTWLIEDLRSGRVSARAINMFGFGAWCSGLTVEELEGFASALVDVGTHAAAVVALDALVHRMKSAPADLTLRERFMPLLRHAFENASCEAASGHDAYTWQLAGSALLDAGETELVARLAVEVALIGRSGAPRPEVLELLERAATASPETVWRALRPALEGEEATSLPIAYFVSGTRLTSLLSTDSLLGWAGTDAKRGLALARMTSMNRGATLPKLARELVARFGASSRAADVLAADIHTTPRAVSSLAEFARETIVRAEAWRDDPDANVRAFAERLLESLQASRNEYAAREENARRRHAT